MEWMLLSLAQRLAKDLGVGTIAALDPIALSLLYQEQAQRRAMMKEGEAYTGHAPVRLANDRPTGELARLFRAAGFAAAAYGSALEHMRSIPHAGKGLVLGMGRLVAERTGVKQMLKEVLSNEVLPLAEQSFMEWGSGAANCIKVVHELCRGSEVVFWDHTSSLFSPCMYIAVDHKSGWVVLSVRGTMHTSDVVADLCIEPTPFLTGRAHSGFAAAAWQLMKDHGPRLARALAAHPGYELVLTGHSMGAGIAALATMLLRARDGDVEAALRAGAEGVGGEPMEVVARARAARCYALACPCVSSLPLARAADLYVTSIVCGKDVIPRLVSTHVPAAPGGVED